MSDSMHRSLDAAIGRQVPAEQVETLANRCICGHAFEWHHDQRGCQYHGNGKGRCRCLRDVPTAVEDSPWLADRLAEARLLGRYEMGVGARPGCDDPEGLLSDRIARERAEAAREALREVANECRYMPADPAKASLWLRARADRIGGTP